MILMEVVHGPHLRNTNLETKLWRWKRTEMIKKCSCKGAPSSQTPKQKLRFEFPLSAQVMKITCVDIL